MTKAFSYIRFSSPEQAKGRSQARQLEECEKYCRTHGLELAREEEYTFLDRGRSAYKAEHLGESGQLFRFLQLVREGSIASGSVLIVESLDRLSREHVKHALPRFIDLLNQGISIVTLTDGRRYTSDFTEMDLIMSIFVMSRAHEESSTKAQRLGDAWRKKQEDARTLGKPMSRAVPMWLTATKEGFQVIEERAEVVRRIFRMAIDGYGKAVTAKALNDDRISAFKSDSSKVIAWGASSVGKVLANRAVIGEYQPWTVQGVNKRTENGTPIPNYYPKIIDDETFYAAKAAIDGRRVSKATKQAGRYNVWQGIVRCSICDAPRHLVNKGKPPKGYTYLVCANSRKGLCKSKAVRLDHAEAVLPHLLLKLNALPLVQDSATKITNDLNQVEGKLAELRKKYEQFRADYIAHPSTSLAGILADSDSQIAKLEKQREALLAALSSDSIMNWGEFLRTVPLATTPDRSRANTFLKRLNVQVRVGKGYFVTQNDIPLFVLAYQNGKVGMLQIDDTDRYVGGADTVAQQLLNLMARNAPFVIMSNRIAGS